MEKLTTLEFKENIFDYKNEKTWKFLGDKPTIVSFSTSWCGPCKQLTPILDQLSKEYDGQINIYKVDIEEESELSEAFQIKSIPTILFIPMESEPEKSVGFMPKDKLIKVINNNLLK